MLIYTLFIVIQVIIHCVISDQHFLLYLNYFFYLLTFLLFMVTICTINLARTDSGTKHCIMAGPVPVKLISQHCYVELAFHIHLIGINT